MRDGNFTQLLLPHHIAPCPHLVLLPTDICSLLLMPLLLFYLFYSKNNNGKTTFPMPGNAGSSPVAFARLLLNALPFQFSRHTLNALALQYALRGMAHQLWHIPPPAPPALPQTSSLLPLMPRARGYNSPAMPPGARHWRAPSPLLWHGFRAFFYLRRHHHHQFSSLLPL